MLSPRVQTDVCTRMAGDCTVVHMDICIKQLMPMPTSFSKTTDETIWTLVRFSMRALRMHPTHESCALCMGLALGVRDASRQLNNSIAHDLRGSRPLGACKLRHTALVRLGRHVSGTFFPVEDLTGVLPLLLATCSTGFVRFAKQPALVCAFLRCSQLTADE